MRRCGGAAVRRCGGAAVRRCGGAAVRRCGGAAVRRCGSAAPFAKQKQVSFTTFVDFSKARMRIIGFLNV